VSRAKYRIRQLTPQNFITSIAKAYGYATRAFAARKAA